MWRIKATEGCSQSWAAIKLGFKMEYWEIRDGNLMTVLESPWLDTVPLCKSQTPIRNMELLIKSPFYQGSWRVE